MSYTYRVLSAATDEILAAAMWYEDKRPGLGDELILNFEAALNNILRNPFAYQIRYKNLRLSNIQRFPYQVVYFVEEKEVTIISFHPSRRNPKRWKAEK
jgi:hypothetical protein